MSKFDDCLETYDAAFKKLGQAVYNPDLLKKVAKGLGPSIYNTDSSKVSSSDKEELARVKKSFLIKKLGLDDSPALDDAIGEVVTWFGKSNPSKYRAVFYYKLVEKFDKASVYN